MYRMCVDCTEFNPDEGMMAHPVFETVFAWEYHRWKSHGGVKPEAKPDVVIDSTPGTVIGTLPSADQVSISDFKTLIAAFEVHMAGIEEQFSETGKRLDALEAKSVILPVADKPVGL